MAEKKTYKFPKTMGTCADRLFLLRQKRLDQKKVLDELEREEKALKEHIINNLPKSDASGVSGKLARVTIVKKPIPQVKDWDAFYKYVKRTNGFDLMQRRLSDAAIKERWEEGKKIPGVESFDVISVSMNKI